MINEILLVFAFVLFVLGGFLGWGPPANPGPWYTRFSLVSFGLACWVLSILLGGHASRW